MFDVGHFGRVPRLYRIALLSILPLRDPLLVRFTASASVPAVFFFVFAINLRLAPPTDAVCGFITTGSVCMFHKASF